MQSYFPDLPKFGIFCDKSLKSDLQNFTILKLINVALKEDTVIHTNTVLRLS